MPFDPKEYLATPFDPGEYLKANKATVSPIPPEAAALRGAAALIAAKPKPKTTGVGEAALRSGGEAWLPGLHNLMGLGNAIGEWAASSPDVEVKSKKTGHVQRLTAGTDYDAPLSERIANDVDREHQALQTAEAEHPGAAIGASIAGGVLSPMNVLAGGAATMASRAVPAVGRAAATAGGALSRGQRALTGAVARGAAYGGAASAARDEDVGTGVAAGGVIGPVAEGVGAAARGRLKKLMPGIGDVEKTGQVVTPIPGVPTMQRMSMEPGRPRGPTEIRPGAPRRPSIVQTNEPEVRVGEGGPMPLEAQSARRVAGQRGTAPEPPAGPFTVGPSAVDTARLPGGAAGDLAGYSAVGRSLRRGLEERAASADAGRKATIDALQRTSMDVSEPAARDLLARLQSAPRVFAGGAVPDESLRKLQFLQERLQATLSPDPPTAGGAIRNRVGASLDPGQPGRVVVNPVELPQAPTLAGPAEGGRPPAPAFTMRPSESVGTAQTLPATPMAVGTAQLGEMATLEPGMERRPGYQHHRQATMSEVGPTAADVAGRAPEAMPRGVTLEDLQTGKEIAQALEQQALKSGDSAAAKQWGEISRASEQELRRMSPEWGEANWRWHTQADDLSQANETLVSRAERELGDSNAMDLAARNKVEGYATRSDPDVMRLVDENLLARFPELQPELDIARQLAGRRALSLTGHGIAPRIIMTPQGPTAYGSGPWGGIAAAIGARTAYPAASAPSSAGIAPLLRLLSGVEERR